MIRTLHESDFDEIHRAFVDAFSDYVVPMKPTAEMLREMFTRRGWVPELSCAVFDGDRIVAFTMNGFDAGAGYDTGTGVVPSHRRRGLARETMDQSFALLRDAGAARYVLEVLEPNTAAAELYRNLGFRETRRMDCYLLDSAPRERVADEVRRVKANEDWWDIKPSWQNSATSIARAKDEHILIGDENGYAIVFPNTGDIPQLAVRPEARRRGIGTRLIETASAIANKPLRFINVDTRDTGIAAFLAAHGAKRFIRQIEMERAL
ncbi:MAG TPA: GNAT family N-acetyltransferase [Thermoanaerobaculia bacterium]|nr:GNAT family N-acetyltransferase [Thermoanaerobaculia bacterium]